MFNKIDDNAAYQLIDYYPHKGPALWGIVILKGIIEYQTLENHLKLFGIFENSNLGWNYEQKYVLYEMGSLI